MGKGRAAIQYLETYLNGIRPHLEVGREEKVVTGRAIPGRRIPTNLIENLEDLQYEYC